MFHFKKRYTYKSFQLSIYVELHTCFTSLKVLFVLNSSVKTFPFYAEYFVIISMLAATCLLWETQKAEIKGYNNRRFKSKDVFHIDFVASGLRHLIFQFYVREDIINCVYP
ncbi:hypothetical protein T12_11615 [Trichinella patagoniensis]|uniref:Uncharacterized protein n=1 Tax=Trichinella patagoniensis TaxID=990121 RepID=A0A0V1A582_9BILA|nr:hypothetical protein T12_11615 [Trichinella patagoniensis]